jgi:hypothetical protein
MLICCLPILRAATALKLFELQDGLSNARMEVRHASAHALIRALHARPLLQAHGHMVARGIADACKFAAQSSAEVHSEEFRLFWAASESGRCPVAMPLDLTLAHALVALIYVVCSQGYHVECMTSGCTRLLMRVIAAEMPDAVRRLAPRALTDALVTEALVLQAQQSPGRSAHHAALPTPSSGEVSLAVKLLEDADAAIQRALIGSSTAPPLPLTQVAELLPRRPGNARILLSDACLLMLHFLTAALPAADVPVDVGGAFLGSRDDGSAAGARPDASIASGSAAAVAADVVDAALHVQTTRIAVVRALRSQGAVLLGLKLAAACGTLRSFLFEPALPSLAAGAGKLCSVARPSSWALSFPPRFQHAMAELRLLLAIFEDITFSSEEAVQCVVDLHVPATSPKTAGVCSDHCSSGVSSGATISFVELLLSCIEWLADFFDELPSAQVGVDVDQPIMLLLHGSLRLVVNLTNHHTGGCRGVFAATRPLLAGAADTSEKSDVDNMPWGLRVVCRVVLSSRQRCSILSQSHAWFDALVLALGLLTNCLEHDASTRAALASGTCLVAAPSACLSAMITRLEGASSTHSERALQRDSSVARTGSKRVSVLAVLCNLFCEYYGSITSSAAPAAAAAVTIEDSGPAVDVVVVAAYVGMVLACCMQRNRINQRAVLAMVGPEIMMTSGYASDVAHPGKSPRLHPALGAIKHVSRIFVSLQTDAGILTDETLQHVVAVEGLLDHIQLSLVDVELPAPCEVVVPSAAVTIGAESFTGKASRAGLTSATLGALEAESVLGASSGAPESEFDAPTWCDHADYPKDGPVSSDAPARTRLTALPGGLRRVSSDRDAR